MFEYITLSPSNTFVYHTNRILIWKSDRQNLKVVKKLVTNILMMKTSLHITLKNFEHSDVSISYYPNQMIKDYKTSAGFKGNRLKGSIYLGLLLCSPLLSQGLAQSQ